MGVFSAGKNLNAEKDSVDFESFQKMLKLSKEKILRDNGIRSLGNAEEFWKSFERDVNLSMESSCRDLSLNWEIAYLGGHKFPDIIAKINGEKSFGVEVKTLSSVGEKWKVMGGSIMESTAEKDVQRIHVFCAKKNPFEIRIRPFEDCVQDVAVTHSPRYLLDLEIPSKESIFQKIRMPYEEIRQMENPFLAFRDYLILEKNRGENGQNAWWLDPLNVISDQDLAEKRFTAEMENIRTRFWDELDRAKKRTLASRMLVLFPEIFRGNYKEAAKWLYRHWIVNPSFRDTFSAGGKKMVYGEPVPQIVHHLYEWRESVAGIFKEEFVTLEERYAVSELPSRQKSVRAWECWKGNVLESPFRENERGVLIKVLDEIGEGLV